MLGENLKKAREQAGLSRRQVAQDFNMHETTYGKYELNKREPTLEMIDLLAAYFKVSVNYLLGKENDNLTLLNKKAAQDGQPISENKKRLIELSVILNDEEIEKVHEYIDFLMLKRTQ